MIEESLYISFDILLQLASVRKNNCVKQHYNEASIKRAL